MKKNVIKNYYITEEVYFCYFILHVLIITNWKKCANNVYTSIPKLFQHEKMTEIPYFEEQLPKHSKTWLF